ncbi:MAG: hypothetical protein ACI37S_03740 [Candidatus Gastranaerophilaceae bacterium]
MSYTLNRYENMLREYIIDQQSDSYNRTNINYFRYNNLRVFMEPSKIQQPHIFVRIGISDACFLITDGTIINGSLGVDTKYVPKWINKPGVKEELMLTWADAQKVDYEGGDT